MNPSRKPASRIPVTRSLCIATAANRTVKSGAAALRIAAVPESIFVWPSGMRMNGTVVLSTAAIPSGTTFARSPRSTSARRTRAISASVRAANVIRPAATLTGARSRSAISMSMKAAPQMAASATSIPRWSRLTCGQTLDDGGS